MVKWMTDANNASNVISEVKRTPLAAMTDLLISTKGALRRPITYITAVKRHCTDGVTKCPKTLQIMPLGIISSKEKGNLHCPQKKLHTFCLTNDTLDELKREVEKCDREEMRKELCDERKKAN